MRRTILRSALLLAAVAAVVVSAASGRSGEGHAVKPGVTLGRLGLSGVDAHQTTGAAATTATPAGVTITAGQPVAPVSMDRDVRELPVVPPKQYLPRRELAPPAVPEKVDEGVRPPAAPVAPGLSMPAPLQSFAGLDHDTWGSGWPPDTVGDVGLNHFVQAVNTAIGIYNKTGTQLAAFTFDTLFSGTGTVCDDTNQGDPTVVYDPQSARFIVADFAFTGTGTTPPFYECIAVSKTSDPVAGGWWLYAIRTDDAAHPWLADYPKMGIWPDGLYLTANMFDSTDTFREVRVWAFDRTDLQSGAPVDNVIVDLNSTTYFSLLPSNYRGALPPAGRENLLVAESQTLFAFHLFKFHVVYSGAGSTFTGPTNVSQTSYTVAPTTVPTPVNALDTLRERLMMQAQYRNIGGTESLWVNHTVRTGANPAPTGIQWAQINVTGGTIFSPPVQQQIYGNLGTDGVHRWMGSLAVDKDGNMALGYSAASASLNPAIRYNGRLATDALNSLPQGEATLQAGGGSQSGNCGGTTCIRWGDYSAMTVDPDGCRFWYTTEYYATTGLNWQTRIGSFKFANCTPVPTAAEVVRFGASRVERGVALSWRTATEAVLLGFNVYRQTERRWQRVNPALIPAVRAGTARGAAYRFVDRTARRGTAYNYRLQLVERSAKARWAGLGVAVARG
jgi:hypothetical protein